jgi:Tle cognate immunity protein 4 C-terminal domain/Tle cognate immunity protein 4 N-terminal domain
MGRSANFHHLTSCFFSSTSFAVALAKLPKLIVRAHRLLVLIVGVCCLQACGPSEKERMTIAELTKDMRTHCIGRHLVDIPKDFELLDIAGVTTIFSPKGVDFQEAPKMQVEVAKSEVSPELFKAAVQKTYEELKAELTRYESRLPYLKFTQKINDTETLFRTYKGTGSSEDSSASQIHLLLNNHHVVVRAESHENKYSATEKWLTEFAHSIQPLTSSNSTQKGFCVGPLVVGGQYESEMVDFAFRSKQHPDIFIAFEIDTYGSAAETTLLQRANDPKNLLKIFDVDYSTLRKGELKVAGIKAQEVLVGFKEKDENGKDKKEHKLLLETMRDKPSATEPKMKVRLVTGQQDPQGERHTSSLSDAEVVAVWDAIIKSIRLRPGAV